MNIPPIRDNKEPMLTFIREDKLVCMWWNEDYVEVYEDAVGSLWKNINIYFNQKTK